MRYDDARRPGGAERLWLRVKLAWSSRHVPRGRPAGRIDRMGERDLKDIGLSPRPDMAPAWWRYR